MYRAGARARSACSPGAASWSSRGAAAAAGTRLVLVDDGFSHWPLARGRGHRPARRGRPLGGRPPAAGRATARAACARCSARSVVVVSRLPPGRGPGAAGWSARPRAGAGGAARGRPAPGRGCAALRAAAGAAAARGRRVRVVTGDRATRRRSRRSAREAGLRCRRSRAWRDHHWFTPGEARRGARARRGGRGALGAADGEGRGTLAGDGAARDRVAVLEVEWEWVRRGRGGRAPGAGGGEA